jgi:PilZ domain
MIAIRTRESISMLNLVRSPELQNGIGFDTIERRYAVVLSAKLIFENHGAPVFARICDLSEGGAMAAVSTNTKLDGNVTILIRHYREIGGRVVWARDEKVGIKFDDKIDPLALLAERAKEADRSSTITQEIVETGSGNRISFDRSSSVYQHRFVDYKSGLPLAVMPLRVAAG